MKTHKLSYNKVSNPATYNQMCKLGGFKNVSWNVSSSQLLKRLDFSDASELIDLAESGEEIKIEG